MAPAASHLGDCVGRAQPAADLHRDGGRFGDPADMVEVLRLARARTVEVDDVQGLGAGLQPALRGVEGVGVERGLAVVVALDQPHRAPVADVDRRVEDQGAPATGWQAAAKPASSSSPAELDFSGWNWAPRSGALLDHGGEALAPFGAADHDIFVGRASREASARNRTGVSAPPVSSGAKRDGRSQRTGSQPMCGTFRPGASSCGDVTGQQAQALRSLVLGRGLEEELHAEADAQQRTAGARPLAGQRVEAVLADAAHRLGERAHAGEDQAVRLSGLAGVG